MKAENGIRRPRRNVPSHPPIHDNGFLLSLYGFWGREQREHLQLGLPLLPGAELGQAW